MRGMEETFPAVLLFVMLFSEIIIRRRNKKDPLLCRIFADICRHGEIIAVKKRIS
jgi:hypothetical protein